MISNLEKYKEDLEKLIVKGDRLHLALQKEHHGERFEKLYRDILKKKYSDFAKKLPVFSDGYQAWYSEAQALIKQLLPDRLADFVRLYERPKTTRKEITHENYTIEDALFGLTVTRGWEKIVVVDGKASIPRVEQQVNILKSVKERFESSLFDVRQLVQADLFDSELEAAAELNKKGFTRGAGAVAGVVLEKHLALVCSNHNIKVSKKHPGISDFNQVLKDDGATEIRDWRFIQRLGDLRNLCDHNKGTEPKKEDIDELIEGVAKISKTIF